ncbi:MAG: PadR family transcriptional regulator [Lachnospiraceae bacterium]|nr:PadR family transcriptional regulator [Lachnospiraceae bacterium]
MVRDMDAQIKKGIIEMCILKFISEEDVYGYPIMQKMEQYFPDKDNSSIYAILRRLCSEGYTETYMGTESGGPARKYYRITEAGMNYLNEKVSEWRMINKIVEEFGLK